MNLAGLNMETFGGIVNGAGVAAILGILKEVVSGLISLLKRWFGNPIEATGDIPQDLGSAVGKKHVANLESKLAAARKGRLRYKIAFLTACGVIIAVSWIGRLQDDVLDWLARLGVSRPAVEVLSGRFEIAFSQSQPPETGYFTPAARTWIDPVATAAAKAKLSGATVVAFVTSFASQDASTDYNLRAAAIRAQIVVEGLKAAGIPIAALNIGELYRDPEARLDGKVVVIKLATVDGPRA